MASIQSQLMQFMFRRANMFGGEKLDPVRMRRQSDRVPWMNRPQKGVQVVETQGCPVHAEWLVPESAPQDQVILYIHGGAWFLGSAMMYRNFVSCLALESGVRALVIDYRLAPENPFPAGLEDCLTAYEWLLESGFSPQKIVAAGDSAGGNLTLALLISLKEAGKPLPSGTVCISPVVDLTAEKPRGRNADKDPIFSKMRGMFLIDEYACDHDRHDPRISPIYGDLHGLPPLYIQAGENEILLDEIERFTRRASDAGVDVKLDVWPEMFHVFEMWGFLPEAKMANREIGEFIRARIS